MAYKRVELTLNENWAKELNTSGVLPIEGILQFMDKNIEYNLNILAQSPFEVTLIVESEVIENQQIISIIDNYFADVLSTPSAQANELVSVNVADIETGIADRLIDKSIAVLGDDSAPDKTPKLDISHLISEFNARQTGETDLNESAASLDSDDMSKWIGAHEFKRLISECTKIAPLMLKSKTADVFISRQYLFSINDGCGFSTYLRTLAETISKLGLYACDAEKVVEIALSFASDPKEIQSEFNRVLDIVERASGKKAICGIDISEWLPRISERTFSSLLRALDTYAGKTIFVFRVPFLEKEALDTVKRIIGDIFTVQAVPFVPFSTEELLQSAADALKAKSFTVSEDSLPLITARISEEKRDGRFYGIHTMRKIVREMIYLKLLANAEAGTDSTEICCTDITGLAESYDANAMSGMEQLDNMVGLIQLKKRIKDVVSQIEMAQKDQSLNSPCIHMRFTGNPGTGKTTVARIIGKILQERGVLRNGNFFEYNGRDFCGQYIGETAPKTASMCRDAYGSVLFIDEAYSLYNGIEHSADYGKEVLSTLISEMENHRNDLLVIMAGYTDEMATLMKGNPGLSSRMPYAIEFPNYSRAELADIFLSMADQSFTYNADFTSAVRDFFDSLEDEFLNSKEFSNARFARNLFERTWGKAVLRGQLENDNTKTLEREDFIQASFECEFQHMLEKKPRKIGFNV